MKHLLVDAQVFHTPALYRGMGKYSLELLDAIMRLNDQKKQWDSASTQRQFLVHCQHQLMRLENQKPAEHQ